MMRLATSIYIVLNMVVFGFSASQAAIHKTKVKHHYVGAQQVNPAPHRVCDWIGPGARAVYRCTIEQSTEPTNIKLGQSDPPQRTCDWVGPGARAVYRCR